MLKKSLANYVFSLFLAVTAFFSFEISAQQPVTFVAPPDLTVISHSWRITRNLPPVVEPPDPEDYQRAVQKNIEDNQTRAEKGLPPVSPPKQKPRNLRRASKENVYIYETRVKNTGNKKIKAVAWEYVFSDPETKRELGRKRFVSRLKINPGEEKMLREESRFPPSEVALVTQADAALTDQYSGRVVIRAIGYTDGTREDFEDK